MDTVTLRSRDTDLNLGGQKIGIESQRLTTPTCQRRKFEEFQLPRSVEEFSVFFPTLVFLFIGGRLRRLLLAVKDIVVPRKKKKKKMDPYFICSE